MVVDSMKCIVFKSFDHWFLVAMEEEIEFSLRYSVITGTEALHHSTREG